MEGSVSDDPDFETLVELLTDEYAQTILKATCDGPMTAKQLATECDASRSTVYRRVEGLVEANLVAEQTRPRQDGHHDTAYVATLDRFEVTLRDGELDVEIDHRSADVADGLTKLWENL
jgi:predicted transcriptional regulator